MNFPPQHTRAAASITRESAARNCIGLSRPRQQSTPGTMSDDGDDVPDQLKCSVCLDAPTGRVDQCTNGHLVCAEAGEGSCLAQLRAHASGQGRAHKCPTCRCPLPPDLNRNRAVEQTIALLPATCRHCAQGTTRGDLAEGLL